MIFWMLICLQKVIVHEEYGQPDDYQNDIALIKLDREVGEGWGGLYSTLSFFANFRLKKIHLWVRYACPGVKIISGEIKGDEI